MKAMESNFILEGDKNIIAGNKLIYHFMNHYDAENTPDIWYQHIFKPHKDWIWIMPVLEKIRQISVSADAPNGVTENRIFSFSIMAPLADVYQATIEFINWHNQNQSNGKTGRGD